MDQPKQQRDKYQRSHHEGIETSNPQMHQPSPGDITRMGAVGKFSLDQCDQAQPDEKDDESTLV